MTNRLDRPQFNQDVKDANYMGRKAGLSGLAWLGIVFVVLALLVGAVWYFKVATSGVKGAGDQTRITNDGRNRVNAQEWFAAQFEQIVSTDRRIDQAAADLAKRPDGDFEKTNYTGLVNSCMRMVGDYNAEANKVSRAQWRDPNLPSRIDNSDPQTDCKETKTK